MRWFASSLVSHDASSLWKTGRSPQTRPYQVHHLVHSECGERGVVKLRGIDRPVLGLVLGHCSLSFEAWAGSSHEISRVRRCVVVSPPPIVHPLAAVDISYTVAIKVVASQEILPWMTP